MSKVTVGINGVGRFGQHLLKYWLERDEDAPFIVSFLNDDYLSLDKAVKLMESDRDLQFDRFSVRQTGNSIAFTGKSGKEYEIPYTSSSHEIIPWIGKPKIFLECSGKNTDAASCKKFLKGQTDHVLLSASSENPDVTLIYGHNHNRFDVTNHKIISYGSCTVNAYVPLAKYIEDTLGVEDSDVNVIHNIPKYKFHELDTLTRKLCTLEWSGPKLLPFLQHNNFSVNYTLVPYTGVSIIDFRFRIKTPITTRKFTKNLEQAIQGGRLEGLYSITNKDNGPTEHKFTTSSSVIVEPSIKILNSNLYLQAYFDNENSVNRYYDLLSYIVAESTAYGNK